MRAPCVEELLGIAVSFGAPNRQGVGVPPGHAGAITEPGDALLCFEDPRLAFGHRVVAVGLPLGDDLSFDRPVPGFVVVQVRVQQRDIPARPLGAPSQLHPRLCLSRLHPPRRRIPVLFVGHDGQVHPLVSQLCVYSGPFSSICKTRGSSEGRERTRPDGRRSGGARCRSAGREWSTWQVTCSVGISV